MTPTELREILNLLINDKLKQHIITKNKNTFEYYYGVLEPETFLSIKSELSELVESLDVDVSFFDEENEVLIEFAEENQGIIIYRLFQNNSYGNTLYRDVEAQLQNDAYRSYFEMDIMATAMSSLNKEERNAISSGIHSGNPYYKKRYLAIKMSIISSIVTVGSATLFLLLLIVKYAIEMNYQVIARHTFRSMLAWTFFIFIVFFLLTELAKAYEIHIRKDGKDALAVYIVLLVITISIFGINRAMTNKPYQDVIGDETYDVYVGRGNQYYRVENIFFMKEVNSQ